LTLIFAIWSLTWNIVFDEDGLLNFRYFTNQTTFLAVGISGLSFSVFKDKPWFTYLAGLTLVNIVLTGLTFHFILDIDRPITLQGHLAHTIVPILYLIYFYLALPGFNYRKFYLLLIYPLVYLFTFVVTGPITGFYPYWFLDIETEGLAMVLRFTLGLMMPAFSLLALILLFTKQKLDQREI
jgi:hypothetical protein